VGTVVIPAITEARTGRCVVRPHDGSALRQLEQRANIITLAETKAADKAKKGPFGHTGYVQFLDHEGYPAIKPPGAC